jgi:type IV secretory pathway VirB3-like protein
MRALIARQLYQPAVVLPLLTLMRLMVTMDFNLAQVMLILIAKSSQYVFHAAVKSRSAAAAPKDGPCNCHC